MVNIVEKMDNPEALEEYYQRAPLDFEQQFAQLPVSEQLKPGYRFWKARLGYVQNSGAKSEHSVDFRLLLWIGLISLFSTVLVKLPLVVENLDADWYVPRFVALWVTLAVALLFVLQQRFGRRSFALLATFSLLALYMLVLPDNADSDSMIMAFLHLPIFGVTLIGVARMGAQWDSNRAREQVILYLGELLVWSTLILLGGMVLTAITLALFNLIDVEIEAWYFENVVIWGAVTAPLVATFVYESVLKQKSRLATMIANIFVPLFLVTVVVYLLAMMFTGRSPYTDRDFLIIFNGLELFVLAMAVFSLVGRGSGGRADLRDYLNLVLVAVTLVINLIALSAIVFRLSEYGVTPNRIAVTGVNLVIFGHLIWLFIRYYQFLRHQINIEQLRVAVVGYLPIYPLWSLLVILLLPVSFGFE